MDALLLHLAIAVARDEHFVQYLQRARDEIPGARSDDGVGELLTRLVLNETPVDVHLMSLAHEADSEEQRAERRRGAVAYGIDRHPVAEAVAGLRLLARKVEELEVAAARNARSRGITGRQLSEATGLSERQITNRYGPARSTRSNEEQPR